MKRKDFIDKYQPLLPTNKRKQFERDLLLVFIDEARTKWEMERELKPTKDHFEQIMDIETNKLKDK